MSRLILFNKPYGVICQFSAADGQISLKRYIAIPGFYPAGRLDTDSEGLVLLTDDGGVQHKISHPQFKLPKTYWVQVEGVPTPQALKQLCQGVKIKQYLTKPAQAGLMAEPDDLWPRVPPIRTRKYIPTSWLKLIIREGRNRQVRRMTAAAGYPTLRLIRYAVGRHNLKNLLPGEWRLLTVSNI